MRAVCENASWCLCIKYRGWMLSVGEIKRNTQTFLAEMRSWQLLYMRGEALLTTLECRLQLWHIVYMFNK